MCASGKCNFSASLALPLAWVSSVKCEIHSSTGLAAIYFMYSCIGPAALPSMSSMESCTDKSATTALTLDSATPPVLAVSP